MVITGLLRPFQSKHTHKNSIPPNLQIVNKEIINNYLKGMSVK